MMEKINLSAVSYLNTRPFLYGIQHSPVAGMINLSMDHPAECARKLISGEAAIGLVPVAAIQDIPGAILFSAFGIGARGAVGSVLLVSNCPLEEVHEIILDQQSRTSVELVRVLAENYWKLQARYSQATTGYENRIAGNTAGVIIGDRALFLRDRYQYVYDLALAWQEFSGLPFVFACWISNRKLPVSFIDLLEVAFEYGVSRIDDLLESQPELTEYYPHAANYLKNLVVYRMSEDMKNGMTLFLSLRDAVHR